jgi:hypothetical protein
MSLSPINPWQTFNAAGPNFASAAVIERHGDAKWQMLDAKEAAWKALLQRTRTHPLLVQVVPPRSPFSLNFSLRGNVLITVGALFGNWIESGQTVVAALTCGSMGASFTGAEMSIDLSNNIFDWPDEEEAPLRRAPYDAPRPAEWQRAEVRKEIESSCGALS